MVMYNEKVIEWKLVCNIIITYVISSVWNGPIFFYSHSQDVVMEIKFTTNSWKNKGEIRKGYVYTNLSHMDRELELIFVS